MQIKAIKVTRDDAGNFVRPKYTNFWFEYLRYATTVDLSGLDTSECLGMRCMFENAAGLTAIDVTHLNTSKVTDMSGLFDQAWQLTSLDVSHFDTSQVTEMIDMFAGTKLVSLDLSNFNTSNVVNLAECFHNCTSLESINLSSFNTSKVSNYTGMFSGCTALKSLDISSFTTTNLKEVDVTDMFWGCSKLEYLNMKNFNLAQPSEVSSTYIFNYVEKLKYIDMSGRFSFPSNSARFFTIPNSVERMRLGPDVNFGAAGCSDTWYKDVDDTIFDNWSKAQGSVIEIYKKNGDKRPLVPIEWATLTKDSSAYDATTEASITLERTHKNTDDKEPVSRPLIKGTDYTVSNLPSADVGEYTVTVTGTESAGYYGSMKLKYTVNARDIADDSFVLITAPADVVFNGKEQQLKPTVKFKSSGKDLGSENYTLSYEGQDVVNANTVKVTIAGEGNFTDTAEVSYQIKKRALEDSAVTVTVDDQTYCGTAIRPVPKVKVDDTVINDPSREFTSDYGENLNVGSNAFVAITAMQSGNFSGDVLKRFAIKKAKMDSVVVSEVKTQKYTGAQVTPEVELHLGENKLSPEHTYEVSYGTNIGPGPAAGTITITGLDNIEA